MNPNPQKYKTMLCKHFSSPKGCSFGDKCQFAHGVNDLRTSNGLPISNPQIPNNTPQDKKVLTFRTIKSLNVNTGKKIITVGMVPCTFAHGDEELRTKSDNMLSNQPQWV